MSSEKLVECFSAQRLPSLDQDVVFDGKRCVVYFVGMADLSLGFPKARDSNSTVYVGLGFSQNSRISRLSSKWNVVVTSSSLKCQANAPQKLLLVNMFRLGKNRLLPHNEKNTAVLVIQRYIRSFFAKGILYERAAQECWRTLDYWEESEALERTRLISTQITEEFTSSQQMSSTTDSSSESPTPLLPPVDDGDSICDTSNRKMFAKQLFESFTLKRYFKLSQKQTTELLAEGIEVLKRRHTTSLCVIDPPKEENARIIVVGDTHGQLNDVAWIFYKFGIPDETTWYIFNGDVSDRGPNAVEIFLLLLAFMIADERTVTINRGNHEFQEMNEVYGFAHEVRMKYGGDVYQQFQEIFVLLPLAVQFSKVFIVHGGLPRIETKIDQIAAIPRAKSCPGLELEEGTFHCKGNPSDVMMFDILWADPRAQDGIGPNSRGAECMRFGPDVTKNFLSNNDLDIIIRSHQVPSTLRGFESWHGGALMTIFSASNYCTTTNNLGAVLIFYNDKSLDIEEYVAPGLIEIQVLARERNTATSKVLSKKFCTDLENIWKQKNRRMSQKSREIDILRKAERAFCEVKHRLWMEFFQCDPKRQGFVTLKQWKACCQKALIADLPWFYLRRKFNYKIDRTVDYREFLSRFRIDFRPKNPEFGERWRNEVLDTVFESILFANLSLKETVMVFDRNSDGLVTARDFKDLLFALNIPVTDSQSQVLLRSLIPGETEEKDSHIRIDAAEFLGRFRVTYNKSLSFTDDPKNGWMRKALEEIGRQLVCDKESITESYYKTRGDESTERRRSSAMKSVALFQKYRLRDVNDRSEAILAAERALNDIQKSSAKGSNEEKEIKTSIKMLSSENSPTDFLTYDELVAWWSKLNLSEVDKACNCKLSYLDLRRLAKTLDISNSGYINYMEFLSAFHVRPTDNKSSAIDSLADEMWELICAMIYENKSIIRHALRKYDQSFSGVVRSDHFRRTLHSLNKAHVNRNRTVQSVLTTDQLDLFVDSLCSSEADEEKILQHINYEDFLSSFVVVHESGVWPENFGIDSSSEI
eukprot:GHVP01040785.1.p1 GENE.GHVP01040785.1~~GHVP01040785.1.p1  ORF type:complete len:1042 (-),score=191.06 GHVP01040785.1:5234-8359(-)